MIIGVSIEHDHQYNNNQGKYQSDQGGH